MRAAAVAALVLALPLGVLPALAFHGSPHDPPGVEAQKLSGSVALPTRFTNGEGGWPGLGRRVWNASAATNGGIAYVFDVDPATWGGAFLIQDVADATGEADLDVYLYSEFGDAGGQAAPTSTAEYAQPGKGGEAGFVAPGTRKAVVFTRNGVNSTFVYRGFTAPRLTIGAAATDLTVAAGATVVWSNGTDDYSFVRHTPTGAGKQLFDSSPKAGTGIPVGGTFSYAFTKAGTYDYETSAGTGTVTVTAGPGAGTPTG